ncbi:multicopper oxidase [Hypholoma sublateritium FD-334 SS-4]|uniref:Multicopper oxidase n=1 Tax=Hypholoma sublateritium (strain FD-334 SS-4) TaxID=945553 RepID=A0A0D2NCZ2_HYPSF|nr:multicopper oxidase [Hypholoma sublateritium FD-334 SS-4]
MRSFFATFTLYLLSGAFGAIGPTANLYIENADISPDGFTRSAVLAGAASGASTFPGPLITGNKGDTFSLTVVNNLTDTTMLVSTSIHWHGFFQNTTAWADGVVGVTQCPIAPTDSFEYIFTGINQTGTYWYHSHYSTQYCDGLRGAMVVYDPNDPYLDDYDVDDDSTVITLADWYHTVSPVLSASGVPPTSDSTLINGLGRYSGDTTADLAVISVVAGTRYRFRLISLSCDPNYVFSIDNHTMSVIEVDGNNVAPVAVDSIQIYAGQRYSFILTANQTASNYWIRATPNVGGPDGFTDGFNSAILRYSTADAVEPDTPDVTSVLPLSETDLVPLTDPAAPGPAVSAELSDGAVIGLAFDIALNGTAFEVNGVTFDPPSVPVLLQVLSGVSAAADVLPAGSVYSLPSNSVIEVNIPGGTPGAPHPIHLHGHAFSVVRSAGSTEYNYVNPVRRDVVNTGADTTDNVTIRFETDNTGPWIMHCHIDWHLATGLAIVMAENITGIANLTHPASWDALCPAFDALPAQTFT